MLSLAVRAAETDNVWMKTDRGSIGIGAFFVEEDTEVRLSSDTLGTGTKFSFQDDLGLDEDDEAVRLAGYYRFKPRHRIEFSYFKISRDGRATVLRDIIFDDEVALGIGYNDVSLEAEDKKDQDELDWDYDGVFGYARLRF